MKQLLILSILLSRLLFSFGLENEITDDDLNIGGDIFSDFNEDIESSQATEDERYYRFGRFFHFDVGLGLTTFGGNRGLAWEDENPTFNLGLHYFMDFHSSFGLGIEYSKHFMILDEPVNYYPVAVGLIDISILRFYFAYRYYVDTADLGTAITYSNPYATLRLEYWYKTEKYIDKDDKENETDGAVGFGLGGGLEFPIEMKKSYVNLEFLFHIVYFSDKYTIAYRPIDGSTYGYQDMTGYAYSAKVSWVFNW